MTTGFLSGVVNSEQSKPLVDVSITITANEGGATRTVLTGNDGTYEFAALLPGSYRVLVERLGYKPKLIEGVYVRAGRDVQLDVEVVAAPPPIEAPERVAYDGYSGASRAGISQSLSTLTLSQLPWWRRETSELGGLSSSSTAALETEGLPAWLSTVRIDGLPYITARHPRLERAPQREVAVPMYVLESADLVTADADGEFSGFAGATLAANTRRGSNDFKLESFGSWSGGGLNTSKFITDNVDNTSLWGGLFMSGPIVSDTAHFALGLELRKLESPFARAWQDDAVGDTDLIGIGQSSFDVELGQYARPFVLQSDVLSGFGRFDWQVANDNGVSVRFGFGHISPATGDADVVAATLPESTGEGNDLFLSASLSSKFGASILHEARVGMLRSTRDYTVDDAATIADLPSTIIVEDGLHFGRDVRLPGVFKRTEVTLDQSAQFISDKHLLKIGLDAGAVWHDDDYSIASSGAFVFSGSSEFAQKRGAFFRTTQEGTPLTKFDIAKIGLFLQDVWQAAPGLRITAGVRYDAATMPQEDILLNQDWFDATGLSNNAIDTRTSSVSPRFSIQWTGNNGQWVVNASAGRYGADVDAAVINELLLTAADIQVTRAAGDLNSWPTPGAGSLPASRQLLSVPSEEFRAPQTDRAAFGFSQRFGSTTLNLSGSYRFTDFLTRRSDLNLLAVPTAHDQNGRPIFGSLTKLGEVVTVVQPNRRFSNFDLVSGLSADGWSRYWGVTAGIERSAVAGLSLFASYTYSHTEDNWFAAGLGGGPAAELSPFPDDELDVWREGTSDFDLPHRVSAGVEWRPGGKLQPLVTALYRYRSGYPFTPGFREGVDANGDGSDSNDPAFVDDDITGMSELISSWSCLREQVGRFAERNACRSEGVHSLNVRVGFTLLRSSSAAAQMFVDGINLIESTQAVPDRALYLVDKNRNLVVNQGTVDVPLVVNPHFGKPLVRFGTSRMLRIGLQVIH